MIDMGIKKVEFRKDTPNNRKKIINKLYFTAYRGPSFSQYKLPNMDIVIEDIHFLPKSFTQTLLYPNSFLAI